VHIRHKEKRSRMDIVERRKTMLQSVADVNTKIEIPTKIKANQYETMYQFIEEQEEFSSWMEWILKYIPWRPSWRHQLIEYTLDVLKGDFSLENVHSKWIREPMQNTIVPTKMAFAAILGIDQSITISLGEISRSQVPDGVILQIALLITSIKGEWRAMLFHDSKETFLHLDEKAEEHRDHIQQIIEEMQRFDIVKLANVTVLVAWVHHDSESKKKLRDTFRPPRALHQPRQQMEEVAAASQ